MDRAPRVVWLGGGHAAFGPDGQRDLPLAGASTATVTVVRTLEALEKLLTAGAHPDLVLSRLFWAGGDALEAARLLSSLGFRGPYRAVAPTLPQPEIVRDEIRRMAPDIDFDLLQIDGRAPPL